MVIVDSSDPPRQVGEPGPLVDLFSVTTDCCRSHGPWLDLVDNTSHRVLVGHRSYGPFIA